MGIEFVGKTIDLTANEESKLVLSYSRDANITEIITTATEKVAVVSLKIIGVEEYITGVIELDQLKKHGNVYELPEAIPYPKEAKIYIGLEDISGKANTVYIGFVMQY